MKDNLKLCTPIQLEIIKNWKIVNSCKFQLYFTKLKNFGIFSFEIMVFGPDCDNQIFYVEVFINTFVKSEGKYVHFPIRNYKRKSLTAALKLGDKLWKFIL